ncbi:MAG: NYN domain-containing protein [Clostridiales bacterium]|nr:NYN domain-containing protein [Clostridiales bacterium]
MEEISSEISSKYAILIDSENVSAKYIESIFDELSRLGSITVRKIYGDWSRNTNGWDKDCLLSYSIQPVQQFSYTTGKNSTDSAMIIDAMDLLYTSNIDGFCLVTSDSDFTRLASRLREAGKQVIGMGERKTPKAFVSACTSFKILDSLVTEDLNRSSSKSGTQDNTASDESNITSIRDIKKTVYNIIDENDDKDKKTHMGEIGSRLVNKYPDFDVRNYGYSKLSTFLSEEFDDLDIDSGRQKFVSIKNHMDPKSAVKVKIIKLINESSETMYNMGKLNTDLKSIIPGFSIKKYGYSKFSSFLKSFGCFEVVGDKVTITN